MYEDFLILKSFFFQIFGENSKFYKRNYLLLNELTMYIYQTFFFSLSNKIKHNLMNSHTALLRRSLLIYKIYKASSEDHLLASYWCIFKNQYLKKKKTFMLGFYNVCKICEKSLKEIIFLEKSSIHKTD